MRDLVSLPKHGVAKTASRDPLVGSDSLQEVLCCKVLYLLEVIGTWDSLEEQLIAKYQCQYCLKNQYPDLLSWFSFSSPLVIHIPQLEPQVLQKKSAFHFKERDKPKRETSSGAW